MKMKKKYKKTIMNGIENENENIKCANLLWPVINIHKDT